MSAHPTDPEGRPIPDASWPPGREAPGRLERARRLLNTVNRENGADHLAEPARAARWLAGEDWPFTPDAGQLAELRRFRDELHTLVRDRGRGTPSRWPAETATATLALDVGDGEPTLVGTGESVERVVADVLAILTEAVARGTFGRLRVCANDHCGWVYYDHSRSGTGQWCSMGACGQRQKMRRYRARRRDAAGGD